MGLLTESVPALDGSLRQETGPLGSEEMEMAARFFKCLLFEPENFK